jgi:aquaporin Z
MKQPLWRAYLVELLGTFALVLFAAGVVCINQLTVPEGQNAGQTPLFRDQPGLVGIALAQGFAFAVLLVLTMQISGGYLNPALTIMLWVFGRMPTVRAAWLIGAQLFGGVLAGLVLWQTFDVDNPQAPAPSTASFTSTATVDKSPATIGVLRGARMGAPHLNPLVYGSNPDWRRLTSGALIEFILTFFLVFAIFGTIRSRAQWRQMDENVAAGERGKAWRALDARFTALVAGLALTACVLFGYPLTGAAANPARWFGPALWEWVILKPEQSPFADMFVFIAGPVAGALVAGFVFFKVLQLAPGETTTVVEDRGKKRAETHVTVKK